VDRFEPNLRIPGPTALPPTVREAGGRQMINHRGPEFAEMLGGSNRHEAVLRHHHDITMITARGPAAGRGGHTLSWRPRRWRVHRIVRRSIAKIVTLRGRHRRAE
jgi:hypothetical protein